MSNSEKYMKMAEEFPFLIKKGNKTKSDGTLFTHLDDLPMGWVEAFAYQMCQELKDVLVELGELETYKIHKVGEKCGILCWQDNNDSHEIGDIIRKYSDIAMDTCIYCPRVAEYDRKNGMSPYCPVCAKKEFDAYVKLYGKLQKYVRKPYDASSLSLTDLFVTHETYETFHY